MFSTTKSWAPQTTKQFKSNYFTALREALAKRSSRPLSRWGFLARIDVVTKNFKSKTKL